MENKVTRYGLLLDQPDPAHWVFGSSSIPLTILQPDGDWTPYLPQKEFQNLNGIEPYACVVFTLLNCIEILIKRKYGIETNWSDRFLAAIIDTRNGGTTPQKACEFLRKMGVVPQDLWPFDWTIDTPDKFFEKIPPELYQLALEFNEKWDFSHEFVPPTHEAITNALRCSPLMMSVAAWHERNGLYYKPEGAVDNHATTLISQKTGVSRRVFDSYDNPHVKDVEWGALPIVAKRFFIEKRDIKKEARKTLCDIIKESAPPFLRRFLGTTRGAESQNAEAKTMSGYK